MSYSASIDSCIKQFLVYPAFVSFITVLVICWNGFSIWKYLREEKRTASKWTLFLKTFSVLTCCALIWSNCSLLRRGIYLPFENENEVECITGTIECVERDRYSPRFTVTIGSKLTSTYGGTVVVDGETFYCLSVQELELGDVVIITFLPESKVILQCKSN